MESPSQSFTLSFLPSGSSVLVWGGYGWRDLSHGPPGCDKSDGNHCTPKAVPRLIEAESWTTKNRPWLIGS